MKNIIKEREKVKHDFKQNVMDDILSSKVRVKYGEPKFKVIKVIEILPFYHNRDNVGLFLSASKKYMIEFLNDRLRQYDNFKLVGFLKISYKPKNEDIRKDITIDINLENPY